MGMTTLKMLLLLLTFLESAVLLSVTLIKSLQSSFVPGMLLSGGQSIVIFNQNNEIFSY